MSLNKKLEYIGIDNPNIFHFLRIFTTIWVFIFLLVIFPFGFIISPIVTCIYYYLFRVILVDSRILVLAREYEIDAVNFFDYFLLILKSGCSIKDALFKVTKVYPSQLSSLVLTEYKKNHNGTLYEIIDGIIDDLPSEVVKNIFVEVKEAYRDGNNLGDSIKMQIDNIKIGYNRDIVKYYRYIPLKVLLLSIACIIIMMFAFIMCI